MSELKIHQSASRGPGSLTFKEGEGKLLWSIDVKKDVGVFILEFRNKIFEMFDAEGNEMTDEVLSFLAASVLAWKKDFDWVKDQKITIEQKMRVYELIFEMSDFGDVIVRSNSAQGEIVKSINPNLYKTVIEFMEILKAK